MKSVAPRKSFQQSLRDNSSCDQSSTQHCLTESADSEGLQWNMTLL